MANSQFSLQSKDGYVRHEGTDWVLGTSVVEKRIRLKDGQFVLASLRNKKSGREYQDADTIDFPSLDVGVMTWPACAR